MLVFARRIAIAAMLAIGLITSAFAATLEEMQLLDAAHYCRIDEMEMLLDAGVNVDARSTGGHTPLIMAAYGQCLEAVELLLDLGADSEAQDDAGYSALSIARQYGYADVEAILADAAMDGGEGDEPFGAERELEQLQPAPEPPPQSRPRADQEAGTCQQMYLSCQQTCGYFSGGQWIMDYSCTAQCSECNRACEAGQPTACTSTFRPWGGQ